MSYILDALKRSDQDRKKGDVPDLHSQPDELVPAFRGNHEPSRNNLLLWVLLPILAGLLVWVLWKSMIGGTSSPPPPAAEFVTAQPTTTPAPASVSEPVQTFPVDVSSTDEPELPQQDDLSAGDAFLDELKGVQLDISPPEPVEATESQSPEVEESAVPPADPPTPAANESVVESGPPREAAHSEPAASEPASSTAPAVQSDPYAEIPHQRQLPYDIQDALPTMNISVHLYSADPSSRLVRINNRIYHEGDQIDGELRLEQITPDGLIMIFRDERFWRNAR